MNQMHPATSALDQTTVSPPVSGPSHSPTALGGRLSITIPVFNEASNIDPLWQELSVVLDKLPMPLEVLFVDDGSTDETAATLDRLAAADSRVRVIHFRRNFGQTAALMAGFDHATGDIIVALDGDLQNDPADIPAMLAEMEKGFDVVCGWRKDRKDPLFSRKVVSWMANGLIGILSGVRIHDYGCTLKAYRAELMHGVRLYGEMHRFIPIFARWQGARITEMPVNHRARVRGKSNYGLERVVKVVLDLMVVKFLHDYSQKPMYVFGGFSLVSFTISFVSLAVALYYKLSGQKSFIETPLPLLCAMSFITGFMCILMGLLAEMIVRTYYESQKKRTYVILPDPPRS